MRTTGETVTRGWGQWDNVDSQWNVRKEGESKVSIRKSFRKVETVVLYRITKIVKESDCRFRLGHSRE